MSHQVQRICVLLLFIKHNVQCKVTCLNIVSNMITNALILSPSLHYTIINYMVDNYITNICIWWNEMSQRHHQQVWRGKTNILIHISCTSHKNVEEHVSDIMNGIIDTEAKLWHKNHGSIKNFFYMLDLKIEECKIYGVC